MLDSFTVSARCYAIKVRIHVTLGAKRDASVTVTDGGRIVALSDGAAEFRSFTGAEWHNPDAFAAYARKVAESWFAHRHASTESAR